MIVTGKTAIVGGPTRTGEHAYVAVQDNGDRRRDQNCPRGCSGRPAPDQQACGEALLFLQPILAPVEGNFRVEDACEPTGLSFVFVDVGRSDQVASRSKLFEARKNSTTCRRFVAPRMQQGTSGGHGIGCCLGVPVMPGAEARVAVCVPLPMPTSNPVLLTKASHALLPLIHEGVRYARAGIMVTDLGRCILCWTRRCGRSPSQPHSVAPHVKKPAKVLCVPQLSVLAWMRLPVAVFWLLRG